MIHVRISVLCLAHHVTAAPAHFSVECTTRDSTRNMDMDQSDDQTKLTFSWVHFCPRHFTVCFFTGVVKRPNCFINVLHTLWKFMWGVKCTTHSTANVFLLPFWSGILLDPPLFIGILVQWPVEFVFVLWIFVQEVWWHVFCLIRFLRYFISWMWAVISQNKVFLHPKYKKTNLWWLLTQQTRTWRNNGFVTACMKPLSSNKWRESTL